MTGKKSSRTILIEWIKSPVGVIIEIVLALSTLVGGLASQSEMAKYIIYQISCYVDVVSCTTAGSLGKTPYFCRKEDDKFWKYIEGKFDAN